MSRPPRHWGRQTQRENELPMPMTHPQMSQSPQPEAETEIDINLDMSQDELYKVSSIEGGVTGNLLPVYACSLGWSHPARKI